MPVRKKKYVREILDILAKGPETFQGIMSMFSQSEDYLTATLKRLLEENEVKYDPTTKLYTLNIPWLYSGELGREPDSSEDDSNNGFSNEDLELLNKFADIDNEDIGDPEPPKPIIHKSPKLRLNVKSPDGSKDLGSYVVPLADRTDAVDRYSQGNSPVKPVEIIREVLVPSGDPLPRDPSTEDVLSLAWLQDMPGINLALEHYIKFHKAKYVIRDHGTKHGDRLEFVDQNAVITGKIRGE
jgi:hypothetical protein